MFFFLDNIFEQIMYSSDPLLKNAQDILKKIANRKLPKFVGEARITDEIKSKVGLFYIQYCCDIGIRIFTCIYEQDL